MPDATPAAGDTPVRLRFTGQGGDLLSLFIKNFALNAVTLGIWSFWGKVAIRKYLYERTVFADEPLSYSGTGGELFRGAIKLGICYAVFLGIKLGLTLVAGAPAEYASTIVFYIILFAITPFAMCAARRYRLSRTQWRGIRFSFVGRTKDCYRVFMPGAALTFITLGLYYPMWHVKMRAYWLNNTYYGDARFHYSGDGVDLMGPFLVSWALLIPTLGFSRYRYKAAEMRYDAKRTSLASGQFHSTVTGMGLFKVALRMLVFPILTLGIAYPWTLVTAIRYYTSRLSFTGGADLDSIGLGERMPIVGASGDEFAGFLDIDMDFGVGIRP